MTGESRAAGNLAVVREESKREKSVLHPSPGFGRWLAEMGGSVLFTTYQSARLFMISPDGHGGTVGLERVVGTAMGLAVSQRTLWVSNKEQIWRFANAGSGDIYGADYQAVYMPRKGHLVTGCDVHDLLADVSFRGRRHDLVFTNTKFSCLAVPDDEYAFRPIWKPGFISAIGPEDRCHLNGIGSREGRLAFATVCAATDTPGGWRDFKNGGGLVIDIETDAVLCSGLSMPHSPRWHDGRLWLLDSGAGSLGWVDAGRQVFQPVAACAGFARGLTFVGDFAVVGLSKLRDNTFSSGLTVKARLEEQRVRERCGLAVYDLRSGGLAHWLTVEGGSTELYDVGFLPGITRPFTPGFSEPALHTGLVHLPKDPAFPLAPMQRGFGKPRAVSQPSTALDQAASEVRNAQP